MIRWIGLLLLAGCVTPPEPSPPTLTLAAFESDATPPIGHRLVGWSVTAESIEAPLLLKGIVLDTGTTRYVLCSLDWCRLQTGAYDQFRRTLAEMAGIPETQVAVQCTHTHGAPIADLNAQLLLAKQPGAPVHLDVGFLNASVARAALALKQAMKNPRPVTHLAYGKAKVDRYASNRRIPAADGKVKSRMSSCKDPDLIAADEGLIDPWVRTISFFDAERPLARLHYYATHPQSYYGKAVSPDVPGFVRDALEKEEGIPHLYFTGCGGNVAAGKYNDGSPDSRRGMIDRLLAGIHASIAASRRVPVAAPVWKTGEVRFALRSEPAFSEALFRKQIADPEETPANRLKAALGLAWIERQNDRPIDCSRLTIGPVTILHLPGEAFVEYQLYAQSLRPGDFIAVAAYGEGAPGYICLDGSAAEGGYEPTASFVGPPSEARFKAAIAELLK